MDLSTQQLLAAIDRDLAGAGKQPDRPPRRRAAGRLAVERQIALDRAHERWLAEDWRTPRRGGRR